MTLKGLWRPAQGAGFSADIEAILALDGEWRKVVTANQEAQERRNALAREIGTAKQAGADTAELEAEASALKTRMAQEETDAVALASQARCLACGLAEPR